ncbi:MAG: ribosome small subunit-dependent GTPase A [Prolixibacteraceae bacterium]|jgi:ribosome biogenesis GTPase|nr:ribosome small subunit-dependent GTPase A [Prolixibacteraceae bacterium]
MGLQEGLVIKSTGSRYTVKTSNDEFECRIKGKFRMKGIRTTNPLSVGDLVYFSLQDEISERGKPMGIISKLKPRKNYIIRKSVNLSKESHILAANIDQAFIVVTKKHPVTTLNFIDRFLVTAEAYNIPAVVVFNKIDIYTSKEMEKVNEWYGIYHEIGYKCLATSTKTGQGMDELKKLMTNKTSVFTGNSGVGKSSLINYIDSNLNLKTDIISEASHKSGKHTTTFSEMFELKMGGYIVDTPGIRSFGMIDMKDDDVSHYFPEIFAISEACKFNNCTHTHEPGCNVKEQVEAGEISISRYESYLSILGEDEDEKYRIGF